MRRALCVKQLSCTAEKCTVKVTVKVTKPPWGYYEALMKPQNKYASIILWAV